MYTSRLDLSLALRKEAIVLLQGRLSDALDLEAQLKQAHWNVKGRAFYQLHQLFDSIHGEVEEMADTLAERIVALGGIADGRIQVTAAKSRLYEYSIEASSGVAHLKIVAAVLGEFGKAARADIDKAAAIGDAGTSDVFTEISRATDKQLWFVEAHLAEE
jgi:starvation-inducible DNA-binding protein